MFILTKAKLSILTGWSRLCRFCSIICRLCSFSAAESINSFRIPTRKHFAKRQQLHKPRYACVIGQSPSFGHINS